VNIPNGRAKPSTFTQICASQNDLFALDEDGNIHQYNFSAKTWEKLVGNRAEHSPERGDRGTAGSGPRLGGA
jgi:hypothetical protein